MRTIFYLSLSLILSDAFTGQAVAGGALGMVIVTGVRRAAFSNEAGMGTEAMAHGAAKTKEPIREGLVAMWGPVIDTLLMCTLTGLVLMVTDVWRSGERDGVLLTTQALNRHYPESVLILLLAGVFVSAFHRCSDFLIMWSSADASFSGKKPVCRARFLPSHHYCFLDGQNGGCD